MQVKDSKVANYGIIGLAALGILLCWLQHWQAKSAVYNPLIPQSISDIYYKPAILFTLIFSFIILLQWLTLYLKKGRAVSAVFGAIVLVGALISYPYSIGWFLNL